MTRRNRAKRAQSQSGAPHPPVAPATAMTVAAGVNRLVRPVLAVLAVGLLGLGAVWVSGGFQAPDSDPMTARDDGRENEERPTQNPKTSPPRKTDSFLDTFQGAKNDSGHDSKESTAANDEMETEFNELARNRDRQEKIEAEVVQGKVSSQDEAGRLVLERKKLVERFNSLSAALEQKLTSARRDRPKDPVPQWLTGELHKLVGGEPDKVLPHLQMAADAGLDRARLFASLAWVQLENNLFDKALQSARKALERDTRDRYSWSAYVRAAFCVEKSADVIERLDTAFPASPPEWALDMRREAMRMQGRWNAEQKLRQAEHKADDLPRVRLIIKHRRFVPGRDGTPTKTEVTGQGEVILELFEDQAPATVANFISLVSKGFYDGTRFHQAVAAMGVAGGDPESKKDDAADDGSGGPGYTIPNESASSHARKHFRGSLTMFNASKPEQAGSQFLITLCPKPGMDGHFTVFGRVLKGQKVIDRITVGRTTNNLGQYGRIIPGDLLFKAEVIRKRPHEYKVIKLEK